MNDEIINNLFWTHANKLNPHYKQILNDEIIEYLNKRFVDSQNFNEIIYRIKYKIEEKPKCKYCNNYTKFISSTKGYKQYCKECKNKHYKETILNNYGVENVYQLKSTKKKIKETNIKKYGVEYPAQNNDIYQKVLNTKIQNGVKLGTNNEHYKQTCLNKYGYEHPCKSILIKEKIKNTNLKRYGVAVSSQSELVKEKMKITCQQKYGVDYFVYSEKLKRLSNSEEAKEKEYNTKLKNNSYTKSKEEDYVYSLLKQKFNDIIRQHRDKNLYPFNCDFYIPNIDLWIEYNGSEFHHYHPFDSTNINDKQELESLKQKSISRKQKTGKKKSRYDSIIYTWTDLDVRKRNIAKQNNLNYIEFWNINDVNKWLENQ